MHRAGGRDSRWKKGAREEGGGGGERRSTELSSAKGPKSGKTHASRFRDPITKFFNLRGELFPELSLLLFFFFCSTNSLFLGPLLFFISRTGSEWWRTRVNLYSRAICVFANTNGIVNSYLRLLARSLSPPYLQSRENLLSSNSKRIFSLAGSPRWCCLPACCS